MTSIFKLFSILAALMFKYSFDILNGLERHAKFFLVTFMWWCIIYVYAQNVKTLNWPFFAEVRTRWWRQRFEYLCIPPKLLTDVRAYLTGVVLPIFIRHYEWKTPVSDWTAVKLSKIHDVIAKNCDVLEKFWQYLWSHWLCYTKFLRQKKVGDLWMGIMFYC